MAVVYSRTETVGVTMATLEKKEKMLVAAIDFGTTFSGYAFSFKGNYKENPTDVRMNQTWESGNYALSSTKAPTCVLFDENRKFHSFGYEAEEEYSRLALKNNHKKWFFFSRFKMKLHNKKINRSMMLKDDKGVEMRALDVFSEAIRYLAQHLLKHLKKSGAGIRPDDIHWVLTVPAIWSDSAKQFMREAANKAGIDGGQLSIALEPEAASVYCQLMTGIDGAKLALAKSGTKYMVIDLGGGTADITVHERQKDGGIRELYKASGGAWGGTKVDEEFRQFLIKLVGAEVFHKFCENKKYDYMALQRELEARKRKVNSESRGQITVMVPISIREAYEKKYGETIEEAINQSPYRNKVEWLSDKLLIDVDLFGKFFTPARDEIVKHIKQLMQTPAVRETHIFLMVGGFSECELIHDAVIDAFPDVTVIIPPDPVTVVLKGAVIFGHRPVQITSRISKYTYGVNIAPVFDEEKHREDHKVKTGGGFRCRDVFKKYIDMGQILTVGQHVCGQHITLKPGQPQMVLKVYASTQEDVEYVDDENVDLIGKVVVKLPDSDERIVVCVDMIFGETELTVEAYPRDNPDARFRSYFDFL